VQYANTTNINASRTTNSAAGSYQMKRGNNLATVAARNDTITGYGPIFTYSGAYGYFLSKGLRANVNYGTGFRAPTFKDLYYPGYGTPNVQPETNRNAEVGLHYEPGNYEIHLVGYQNKVQNLIQALPCTTQASGYCPTNFASVNITGASLGANTQLDRWYLKGSLDLLNAVDQNTGLALANRAKQLANLGAEYRSRKLNFGSNLTVAGQRYGNAQNTVTMNSYALLDLYASYEIQPKWSLFARWNNALNSQYQLAYGYLTPGSNIFAGVRYTP
jgi:vitamin B12 transporter